MTEMQEILREFLIEGNEFLDQFDRDLIVLENEPGNTDVLASIFRTLHTFKGTSAVFDLSRLGALAHAGENLLSLIREGKCPVTPTVVGVLLAVSDALRASLARIEKSGGEGDEDHAPLIARLHRLRAGNSTAPVQELDLHASEARPAVSDTTIRIDVGLLDRLMNLVGELVLARNQVLQHTSIRDNPSLLSTTQRLNLITTELQEGVMKTRLQPIANIWNKLPRVCRDLAQTCGKQIRLSMEGKQTELDKSIIEAIKDPLTHLIRNAIDHGIEPPEVRRRNGKPAEGTIAVRAYHEGGQVNIEVADDGGGIEPRKVLDRAVDRGLLGREQAARLNEREILHLVFLPGFSTAEKITSVSGRGVGMDVVKTNIEKISGVVDIHSRVGHGTTVRIKIPLTLAIIPALLVSSGGDHFAIPQVSLLELVRLEGEQVRRGIENIHGAPVYRLRGNLLPLVYLNRELQIEDRSRAAPDVVNIVVIQADHRPFGLVVDGINDTEEIVVKPLGKLLKGIPLYAGATILGDGRVALILDVLGLAQAAGVISETQERSLGVGSGSTVDEVVRPQAVLLVGMGADRRLAIPLDRVARLEEVPANSVEYAGGGEAIQYRGKILPLVRLANLLPGLSLAPPTDGSMQVVVAGKGEGVGLVVDRILDIVEATIEQQPANRRGVSGSAIIQQRVTDLVDVDSMLALVGQAF